MTDFNIGDRVKVVDNLGSFASYVGESGTILRESGEGFTVQFDGRAGHLTFFPEELEVIENG